MQPKSDIMQHLTTLIIAFFTVFTASVSAQESDLQSLLGSDEPETNYTIATFKSTRIVNGQSVELTPKGEMIFTVSHHFGRINTGIKEFFGLDQSTVRLGLEYGLHDRITLGLGRSSFRKVVDGSMKVLLLRQQTGQRSMPVTAVYYASANVTTAPWANPEPDYLFAHRWVYAHQLLVARKFTSNLSLQLSPTWIHYNLVPTATDYNDLPVLGAGGRYKLLPRITVNAEYYFIPQKYRKPDTDLSFSAGMDLETGGHVFQLFFTNSMAIYDPGFMAETTGKWRKGDVYFGFNITRVFTIKRTL
jgi:hypothetical protein